MGIEWEWEIMGIYSSIHGSLYGCYRDYFWDNDGILGY